MQLLLPLIPAGATTIANALQVFKSSDGQWTYFSGAQPIYCHAEKDLISFRMITSQLINMGACRIVDIHRAFGVPEISLKRQLKAFRENGPGAFYPSPRRGRSGTIMNPEVLLQAQAQLDQGKSRRDLANELKIPYETLKKAIHSGRLLENRPAAASESSTELMPPAPSKSERSAAAATCPMGKACHREDERFAAAIGALSSASIRFEAARDLKYGGAFVALPALEANGLFVFLRPRFTLPPGYYDVMHIVLTLAFMALLRIKTHEQLRFEDPGELGRLIGLDRIPEVKTLRAKIKQMCTEEKSRAWMLELSKHWMEAQPELAGAFYVDGHVRLYHGAQTELPRRFVSREKLCLRGITDYYVNDALGRPFFVVSKTLNEGMNAALIGDIIPQLLKDAPQVTEAELAANPFLARFIMVFDRESSGRNLFEKLWRDHRVACISYQKNVNDKWHESEFSAVTVTMPCGENITMKLAERGTAIGSGKTRLWVKEIRRLTDSGHQTSVITTAYHLESIKIAALMFARWSQENFFGYAMEHYNIDHLIDYQLTEFPDPDKAVINPERRRLESSIKSCSQKLNRQKVEFASAEIKVSEVSGKTAAVSRSIQRKAELREAVEATEKDLIKLKEKRSTTPNTVAFKETSKENQFKCLDPSRKIFSDAIKFIAYRAETSMAENLKEYLGKSDDARRLICDLMSGEADLMPDTGNNILHVGLHRLSNPQADDAVRQFLVLLNDTDSLYPGTQWRLRYHLVGDPLPAVDSKDPFMTST